MWTSKIRLLIGVVALMGIFANTAMADSDLYANADKVQIAQIVHADMLPMVEATIVADTTATYTLNDGAKLADRIVAFVDFRTIADSGGV